jgi:hypothetical protein
MRPVGNLAGSRYAGSAMAGEGPGFRVESGAIFSPDRVYRYSLGRRWGEADRFVLWVMLNPSTADAQQNDPTIRRCIALSAATVAVPGTVEGYAALAVVNLFALRSPDPTRLVDHHDPVGPRNDEVIAAFGAAADAVIVAWGAMAFARERARAVISILRDSVRSTVPIACYGITRSGAPRHPLYIPGGTAPVPFRLRSERP